MSKGATVVRTLLIAVVAIVLAGLTVAAVNHYRFPTGIETVPRSDVDALARQLGVSAERLSYIDTDWGMRSWQLRGVDGSADAARIDTFRGRLFDYSGEPLVFPGAEDLLPHGRPLSATQAKVLAESIARRLWLENAPKAVVTSKADDSFYPTVFVSMALSRNDYRRVPCPETALFSFDGRSGACHGIHTSSRRPYSSW